MHFLLYTNEALRILHEPLISQAYHQPDYVYAAVSHPKQRLFDILGDALIQAGLKLKAHTPASREPASATSYLILL